MDNDLNNITSLIQNISIDNDINFQKPFLKWVGGKTQIIDKIINFIPKKINTYYEPFVGGGSVLLSLLNKCEIGEINIKKFIISDKNCVLINLYIDVKKNVKKLMKIVDKYAYQYNSKNNIKSKEKFSNGIIFIS